MAAIATASDDQAEIRTDAIVRVTETWGLTNPKLEATTGVPATSPSRLRSCEARLVPASKSFEAGQSLAGLLRSLNTLPGSDNAASDDWLTTANLDLGGKPIEQVDTMSGLMAICKHADVYQARE